LLLLRQRETPLVVYATGEMRTALDWLDMVLNRFCGVEWRPVSRDFISLSKSIVFRPISLPGSIALQFRDQSSNASALIAPAVSNLSDELHDAVKTSDVIMFDGTFWKDDELLAVRPGARRAREMNHLPIADGSLDFLRHSPARRKMYTHINNTNPILMPGSPERAQVEQAGIEIACDGLEIAL
jgi:pyrroloquinoline quinone biosynthesis protein B